MFFVVLAISSTHILADDNKILSPDFELVSIDSGKVKLSDFRGKLVLLNFWALGCGYCEKEAPILEKLHQEYREKGLEVVAVIIGTWWTKREEWSEVSFTLLVDPKRKAARKYFVLGVPVAVLISSQGEIIQKFIGYQDWLDPKMIEIIEENLPKENLEKNNGGEG